MRRYLLIALLFMWPNSTASYGCWGWYRFTSANSGYWDTSCVVDNYEE